MKLLLSALLAIVFSYSFTQNTFTPEIMWKLKRLQGGIVSPNGQFILYNLKTYDVTSNKGNNDLFLYDLKKGKVTQLTKTPFSEMDAQWDNNNNILFLSSEKGAMQIWRINTLGEQKTQMSFFKNIQLEGFKLAPNGQSAICIEAVKTKANLNEKYPDLPLADARIEDGLMYRHWDQYDDYKKRHLVLHPMQQDFFLESSIDLLGKEAFDGIIPPFGGIEQFTFSPDSKTIVYSSKKLTGKDFAVSTNSELYAFNLGTKQTEVWSTSLGYDNHPEFSPNGNELAWLSMETPGFEASKNDILLRNIATGEITNITKDIDLTVSSFIWDKTGTKIYFLAPTKGTIQIFELNPVTKEHKQISSGRYDYLSIDIIEGTLITTRQSMVEPTDLFSIDIEKLKTKQLTAVNKEILEGIIMPTVEERWVTTSDSNKMLVWMILPPNFDPNKKYPTLLYCQGGPQSQVSQFFSYRWNFSAFASEGYIVVAPNRRGLPGFGQKWNDAISKDWGGQPIRDYLSAIDDASKLPYVDENRLGAIGASYGGYSVYFLAGNHNNRFKTFVSHCGLFNFESWYGTTEELFFANHDIGGPYWNMENKKYYEKNSPHKFVQNWNTPILVIHGANDFRVPETEGMQAFQAAQLLGLKSKYLSFPNEGHWVNSPQNGLLWYREVFEWLNSDLK
jgi:dipeptidyl aminopeptidase/acylaminoacyl peptidase